MPRHIRKGDTVIVTAGTYKGAVREVLRIIPKQNRVVVQGVNMCTKHLKPTQANPQGGIIKREAPIHISNVSPVVQVKVEGEAKPVSRPTRVRYETRPDGAKVRVAARDGSELHVLRGSTGTAPAKKKK